MKKILILICIAMGLVAACDKDPYPGYTAMDSEGMYLKVIEFEDGDEVAGQGDVLRFRMARVDHDSVVWHDSRVQLMRYDSTQAGLASELYRFHVGDSVSVLMQPAAYKQQYGEHPQPIDRVSDMHFSILGIIPTVRWEEAVAMAKASSSEKEEKELTRYFAGRSDIAHFEHQHGYWQRVVTSTGDSRPFVANEDLLVMYTATLLDGTLIDERNQPAEALSYRLGMQGQLIPGLVAAIKQMERGQTLELILPSAMAFGERGSAGAIVAPWTPVRYLLRVSVLGEEVAL